MERALIIRKEHLDKILDGSKTWEMRSAPTKIRGKIGLIEAGTGLIVGECEIIDSLDRLEYMADRMDSASYHQVDDYKLLDKWCYPWVLENVKRYDKPIRYDHPKGAVIWVKL